MCHCCAAAIPSTPVNLMLGYGNLDIVLGPFLAYFSARCHPHARRVTCSTSCPCFADADWCLQSDIDVFRLSSDSAGAAEASHCFRPEVRQLRHHFWPFLAHFAALYHPTRVVCSTSCPCLSDADWCVETACYARSTSSGLPRARLLCGRFPARLPSPRGDDRAPE